MALGDPVRIVPHRPKGIPDTGSFEVRYADGRPSVYFYWDDNAGRRAVTGRVDQAAAKSAAQTLARRK